jgi:hypothetical protein
MFCRSLTITLAMALGAPAAHAAGRVPYGTRAGMEVEITEAAGLDTARATIKVRHTRDNAREYCTEYVLDPSDACVDEVLKDIKIPDSITADCGNGRFVDLLGRHMVFAGANLDRDAGGVSAEYRIFRSGEKDFLNGDMASNYPAELEQFKALCRAKFAQAERDFQARPKYIGRWYTGDKKICREPEGAGEGLLTYRSREFVAIDTVCKITNVRASGERYDVAMSCASEGEDSPGRETLEVKQGRLERTVTVGRKPVKFTYARCPFPF